MTASRSRIPGSPLLALAACFVILVSAGCNEPEAQVPDAGEWPRTDFTRASVDLGEISSGGPPKDGIPAIDHPRFESVSEASIWLDPREPVISVTVGAHTKAYPLQILIWHEIVNDAIGDTPTAVTFCPLCNSSVVFDRRVAAEVLDFGTTGRLRKSDLVMYDRQSESWWQQLTGEAIVGAYAGTRLEKLPGQIAAFADFRLAHPHGEVLSRETGRVRPYGTNPYRGYDRIGDRPFLFNDPLDPRLPPMERVLNVSRGDEHKLYPFTVLERKPVINDEIGGRPVVILSRTGTLSVLDETRIARSRTVPSAVAFERELGGRVLTFELAGQAFSDKETGSTWDLFGRAVAGPLAGERLVAAPGGVHFAFAWLAFNPASIIYQDESREEIPERAGPSGRRP